MKKILKWIGILLLAVILGALLIGFLSNESRPEVNSSPEADALARKMMTAVDKAGWDTTGVLQWTFRGVNHYLWDKSRNYVKVKMGENEVLLNTKQVTGKAYTNGAEVTGAEADKLVQSAWSNFCNDSWWFNAVIKAFDPGTLRSIVKVKDGREGLMVSYESGGVTPGDAYVWFLDESGLPTSYKMWVEIIPIGGLEATWEGWTTLPTGAKIATLHKIKGSELPITNVKGARDFAAFGIPDPFAAIAN